ncbi:glycine--tRNA ligase subunit beta [Helicobacter enhydrae]|uniref:Glycine--tRNA ligase beta subunit n=1 Tax=Helicobacter enhydrae TaxID=222136 RepID=A0A1B1U463_9HELI|nr:glycine--tRNA ligase subunit beta [Helicobacter enhydrae]ANV97567.1 glycine--tRNA ligase subunit beta [Helicobacter enhydrae]
MKLLIEILTEELPAIPFLKEEKNILQKWMEILRERHLDAECQFFYTPRRIVLYSEDFPQSQATQKIELFGPPVQIAYQNGDVEQGYSQAGESFVKKCGGAAIQRVQKGGKEVLYCVQEKQGEASAEILGEMIATWLDSLHFGKSMRWGSLEEGFIRPIRNIAVMLGTQRIECECFGVRSQNQTFVHRDFGFEPMAFGSVEEYFGILQKGGIVLSPKERREQILSQIREIEEQSGLNVEIDEDLLCEVVAITEYPRALLGCFEAEYLQLPSEVIITSMKENQRYFAVFKEGRLHHQFVVVINSMSADTRQIVLGNEKVLRARLSDAMFFYQNDLKRDLASYDLSKIAFVEGLGSMQDKIEREQKIAKILLEHHKGVVDEEDLLECIAVSKSDLLSEMVGEFPELQGVMGRYYAVAEDKRGIAHRGRHIAQALQDQYLPKGEGSALPQECFGSIVALSYRIDVIMALFSVGKIPSGSKDPFALRRCGNGILRIIKDFDLLLTFEMLEQMAGIYQGLQTQKVWEFLLERMEGVLKLNPSILRSVIQGREKAVGAMMQKAVLLNEVLEGDDKETLISTFKRVANITKEMQSCQKIDVGKFQTQEERDLYEAMCAIDPQGLMRDYIRALFALKPLLERFFDAVMVNVEDEGIRENRKALIYRIYEMFLEVGDIKEIAI